VIQIDVRLILHLAAPVLWKQMLQLFRKLLQVLIPKLGLGLIGLLSRLLIQIILEESHVGGRVRCGSHLVR
jgi:hypothetical protein